MTIVLMNKGSNSMDNKKYVEFKGLHRCGCGNLADYKVVKSDGSFYYACDLCIAESEEPEEDLSFECVGTEE